MTLATG